MHVLIVRLSSMGDMVHTLPALTDAATATPGIRFDWVVDEAFAEIPTWHTAVETVIACPPRRWGKPLLHSLLDGHMKRFLKNLRRKKYDFVIDVQTEIKSALPTRMARGLRYGYDRRCSREWGAHFAYQKQFFVPYELHSITRMRRLLALAIGYSFDESNLDYGIDRSRLKKVKGFHKPYIVFVHCGSWPSKNWEEDCWRTLLFSVASEGYSILLPWGNEAERKRAERIAGENSSAIVLPPMTIGEKAAVLADATATVGCDTGLSHIAAALDIPSITLYGPTDPALIGASGRNQVHIASHFECVQCHKSHCSYPNQAPYKPACLAQITPDQVLSKLHDLLQPASRAMLEHEA